MTDHIRLEDDPRWAHGDVTIISSDGVRLRVTSAALAWASSIFEDMLSLPPGDKQAEVVMELSDKLFEDAQTLRSFLSLIYDMKLDFPISWDHGKREYLEWRDRITNLLTFMDKYNSEKGYKLLRLWSNHAQQAQSWSPHGAFVFGAMTNDIHMCVKALEDSTSDSWRPDDSSPIGARRLHLFQLGAAPYDFFCSIPPQYAFALARAGVTAEPGSDAFRDEFVTTVTAALKAKGCEHSSTSSAFAAHMYDSWGSSL